MAISISRLVAAGLNWLKLVIIASGDSFSGLYSPVILLQIVSQVGNARLVVPNFVHQELERVSLLN